MFNNILKNISPVVKNILLINVIFYVAQWTIPSFTQNFELYPITSEQFRPWQLATHFFMHSPYSIGHIFFNMFALVIFGSQLEKIWGPQKFLIYYISCALGASILHLGVTYFRIQSIETGLSLEDLELFRANAFEAFQKGMNFKDPILAQLNILHNSPMLGASGAIFGLLAAFGYLFPNTELMLLFPPIPIKAKYFVIGYAVLELYLGISNNPSDNVAHFAHLGGALIGIIIVLYWSKKRNSFFYEGLIMGLYLDYNASAPMLNSSIDAMVEAMKLIGNPSSIHSSGRRAKNAIEDSRELVAETIDIKPQNIIFTSGASESNSLAFKYAEKMKIITSAIEHESVLEHKKMDSIIIPVNQNGIVNLDYLKKSLHKNMESSLFVSIMAVNNETGVIQPIEEIAALCLKYNAFFHVDAVQAIGRIEISMTKLNIDLLN